MLLPYLDPPDFPENVEDACLVAGGDGQLVEAPQLVQEHYITLQYNTVRCSTVQYSTVQYSTWWRGGR